MKKGFTLIELIIAIALASVLLAISSKAIQTSIKLYCNEADTNKDMFYLKEATMYIESEVQNKLEFKNEKMANQTLIRIVSVIVNNNNIIINKEETKDGLLLITHEKEIFLNTDSNLVVAYKKNGNINRSTINNLVRNIKSFTCSMDGNLMYISIESKNGDKIERCIELNSVG